MEKSTNIKRTPKELYDELCIQLKFLKDECKLYDEGEIYYAKKIALTLRLLLYSTKRSNSLINQICKTFLYSLPDFINMAYIQYDGNESSEFLRCSLIEYNFNYTGDKNSSIYPVPILYKSYKKYNRKAFKSWWENQIVMFVTKDNPFTRKEIVSLVADKIGGAHIDAGVPDYFSNIISNKSNSFNIHILQTNVKVSVRTDEVLYACIRTIAEEAVQVIEQYIIPYCKTHLSWLKKPNYLVR